MPSQAEKAAAFAALHTAPGSFVLPNPWDVGSARMLANLGYKALATTSAGMAWSMGLNDGEASRAYILTGGPLARRLED